MPAPTGRHHFAFYSMRWASDMIRIDDILDAVRSYHSDADLDAIRKAYVFSAKVHLGQTRLSGDPYMTHLLEVAYILTRLHMDVPTVVTGLLHDTLEDTLTTEEELRELFGPEVAAMVDGVTKIGKYAFRTSEERQAENFRKMLLAMARDLRVIMIKLADRLHNMRTLAHQAEKARLRIAGETRDIYAPLANRLGISWIKSELEDLAFAYLEPDEYQLLADKIAQQQAERDTYVTRVKQRLETLLAEHKINGLVQGRLKHLYSIHNKMVLQQLEYEQVHDVIAFRIVVPSLPDCYAMLGVIHSCWKPVAGRFKDYVAMPKANMYQSLHTTVMGPGGQRMEVQIRTDEMHRIAEEGIAAHWQYKEGGGSSRNGDMARFSWLRGLLEWQQELKDSSEFMNTVKVELFPEEVYVFTPNGDVKELPKDSTPVDFAYSVHSDIGHHCTGAKVNGRLVPLKTILRNGDSIEVMTSPNQTPSKDWLRFVKSSKARNRIRYWVKEQERQRSLEIGKEILEKDLRKYNYSFNRAFALDSMEKTLADLGLKSTEDLLAAIGYGKLTSGQVLNRLLPEGDRKSVTKPGRLTKVLEKIRKKPTGAVRVQGMDDIMVRFAKCCKPLAGDPIVGFISRGKGVTVHVSDCPHVLETDPARRIDVTWDTGKESSRPATIKIYSNDQKGMLANLSSAVSQCEANIIRANAFSTAEGRGVFSFEVEVRDLDHLKRVMDVIRKVKGVHKVERVLFGQ